MTDKDIWAVKAGPFVVGGVSERKPESPWIKIVSWVIALVLVAVQVHPLLGVVVIIGAAIYLAARTAPADNERKP